MDFFFLWGTNGDFIIYFLWGLLKKAHCELLLSIPVFLKYQLLGFATKM